MNWTYSYLLFHPAIFDWLSLSYGIPPIIIIQYFYDEVSAIKLMQIWELMFGLKVWILWNILLGLFLTRNLVANLFHDFTHYFILLGLEYTERIYCLFDSSSILMSILQFLNGFEIYWCLVRIAVDDKYQLISCWKHWKLHYFRLRSLSWFNFFTCFY